jgi:predicted AAA+ superfamily ATPase
MIARHLLSKVAASLGHFPVVGLIGPRQVGKTTLAKAIASEYPGTCVYLDLESPADAAKLTDAEMFLSAQSQHLVIIDEVQRHGELFPILRSLVDRERRPGRFLILGSASPDLARQASESLAGRIVYHELCPLSAAEVDGLDDGTRLWVRGGYPDSFLAPDDLASMEWRQAFIRTHLERDIPALGSRIPSSTLGRFWQMLAHCHGQLWNASQLAGSLGVTGPTVVGYLDLLQDTFMVRRLPPYHANLGKRLVKTPKVYLRDSGLLHALLRLPGWDDLQGHPVVGASWEGWCIEQILAGLPSLWTASFYRTHAGAEIDLVLEPPGGGAPLAVEFKHSLAPKVSKGFWSGMEDIGAARGLVVYPGTDSWPLAACVEVIPVSMLPRITAPPTYLGAARCAWVGFGAPDLPRGGDPLH